MYLSKLLLNQGQRESIDEKIERTKTNLLDPDDDESQCSADRYYPVMNKTLALWHCPDRLGLQKLKNTRK